MEEKPKLHRKRERNLIHEQQNQSLKTSRIASKDRFSDLPIEIIQHILSFASVKDAVTFCTLSRHWLPLWTSISNLSFRYKSDRTEFVKYVDKHVLQNITNSASFIDKALSLYTAPKLKTFLLQFRYHKNFKERVKSWICFSLTHEVEELYVHLIGQEALRSSKVSDWFDNWCGMSLKVISLASLSLDMEMIEAIFRGSPLLECLKLRGCYLIKCSGSNFLIDATNTRLKILALDGCVRAEHEHGRALVCEGWVEIRGPDLVSLTLNGHMWKTKFRLVNLSSMVEANIDFLLYSYKDENEQENIVKKLLHVNRLTIGDRFLQVLRNMSLDGENFSTLRCKILELNVSRSSWCYSGLKFVLQNSRLLEQLIINMRNFCRYGDKEEVEENCWRSKTSRCFNHNLKRVEIKEFVIGNSSTNCCKILLDVVQLLLDNAKVLQKLIVHAQVDKLNRTLFSNQPKKLKTMLEELEAVLAIKEKILHFSKTSDALVVFKSGLLV